jgi:hypothetical protein
MVERGLERRKRVRSLISSIFCQAAFSFFRFFKRFEGRLRQQQQTPTCLSPLNQREGK